MLQIIDFIREILQRLQLESPALYKKLQWISGILATLIGAALSINSYFDLGWGLILIKTIPLTHLLLGAITFLGGIFATSKTTVENKKELNKILDK